MSGYDTTQLSTNDDAILASDQEHVDRLVRMRHDLTSWMTEQGDTETVFGTPELLPTETP
ncbi:MAG TPA: hypothetical protein VM260_01340 [Pirellula sp.]|nr:hypothetical protein [Pirellula sp.]